MGIPIGNQWQDEMVDAILTLDHAHHEIHTGNHWFKGFANPSLADGATIGLLFVTDVSTDLNHMFFIGQSDGIATFEVFEGVTTSNDGTQVTPMNRHRELQDVRQCYIETFTNPTVTDLGTQLSAHFLGSEGFKAAIGGNVRSANELLLKPDTKYYLRITNNNGSAIRALLGGDWYRHDTAFHTNMSPTYIRNNRQGL